jgi:hypothetical protein
LISAKAMKHPWSDHSGMIAGLSPSPFGIVASSTFKCWETISGGECGSQLDKDTSDQFSVDGADENYLWEINLLKQLPACCAEPSDRTLFVEKLQQFARSRVDIGKAINVEAPSSRPSCFVIAVGSPSRRTQS